MLSILVPTVLCAWGESLWSNITTNYIGIWVSYIFRQEKLACHLSRKGLTPWFCSQCCMCNTCSQLSIYQG